MTYKDLHVNEIFGPTFQGEGPLIGTPVVFLRLAGCNLHCSWCDTKYTWNFGNAQVVSPEGFIFSGPNLVTLGGSGLVRMNEYGPVYDKAAEVHRMSTSEVNMKLFERKVDTVVISGGEPMLQQEALMPVISAQVGANRVVQFETNGTVLPNKRLYEFMLANEMDPTTDAHVIFVVSPKLKHADAGARATDVDYGFWQGVRASFKFVCQTPEDLDEVAALNLNHERVYIMPEGTTREQVLRTQEVLAPHILERGWSMTTRLHVLLWGSERAR